MRTYDTIIGERPFLNTDGNGISIKPLTNPSLNVGSIIFVLDGMLQSQMELKVTLPITVEFWEQMVV